MDIQIDETQGAAEFVEEVKPAVASDQDEGQQRIEMVSKVVKFKVLTYLTNVLLSYF